MLTNPVDELISNECAFYIEIAIALLAEADEQPHLVSITDIATAVDEAKQMRSNLNGLGSFHTFTCLLLAEIHQLHIAHE